MTPPDRRIIGLALAGLALWLLTAITNVGLIAIDDYTLLSKVLPAARHTAAEVLEKADYRTPLPTLLHLGLAKVASALGVAHPVDQVRFNQAVIGLASFLLMFSAGLLPFARLPQPERERHQLILTDFLGFYCLAPFFFTRSMVESLCAPLVLAGTACACAWYQDRRWSWMVWSTVAFGLAAMLRPQVGIAALALPMLLLWQRRWRDLGILALTGTVVVIVTGLPDLFLRGAFHRSLIGYVDFNLHNSSRFGTSPWYTFLPTLLLATLPPVFFSRYRGFPWKERYGPLLPALLALVLFVASHSAVPHKEERFLVPILPVLLLLLTPLASWLLYHGPRWRWITFVILNTVLLVLIVLNAPQATGMKLADWVDRHPGISSVTLVDDRMFVPTTFVTHPVVVDTARATRAEWPADPDCGNAIVTLALGKDAPHLEQDAALRRVARFEPGPLERLIVAINPRHNARRGPVEVYLRSPCGD